jgi:predicted AAA+ superfamily ATPase
MEKHYLDSWSQYLSKEDYNYLIKYVENVKYNIPNDKMIILYGPPSTGKSTLQRDIIEYLGDELCGRCSINCPGEIIYETNIKRLIFFCEIDEIYKRWKIIRAFINFIKYKQSFISIASNIDIFNNKLLEHCKVINMFHVF